MCIFHGPLNCSVHSGRRRPRRASASAATAPSLSPLVAADHSRRTQATKPALAAEGGRGPRRSGVCRGASGGGGGSLLPWAIQEAEAAQGRGRRPPREEEAGRVVRVADEDFARYRFLDLRARPENIHLLCRVRPLVDGDSQDAPPARPIGRDSAKKMRSDPSSSGRSNSAYVECLQKLTMSQDKEMEVWSKEAEATDAMTAVAQQKLAVQTKMADIKEKQLQMEERLRSEELRIRQETDQKKLRMREEELREARQKREAEEEMKIMLLDLSQFDPLRRAYFAARQQEIFQKQMQRGSFPGGPSGSL